MIRFSLLLFMFALAACGVKGVEETERSQTSTRPAPVERTVNSKTVVIEQMADDHAGGEAHEHGRADMAVTIDRKTLTISLIAPLANFGLKEGGETVELGQQSFSDGMIELSADAACVPSGSAVQARQSGDHGTLSLEMNWTCQQMAKLKTVKLNAFERYPGGFETVSAIVLNGNRQVSGKLTPDAPSLLVD